MKSRFILLSLLIAIFLLFPILGFAQNQIGEAGSKVTVYFFWGKGCPHCAREAQFLEKLEQELPYLEIKDYEVWYSTKNALLMAKIIKELQVNASGTPLTIVGEKIFSGYYNDEVTGAKIKQAIVQYSQSGCPDIVSNIISGEDASEKQQCIHECGGGEVCEHDCGCDVAEERTPEKIVLPLLGEVNVKSFSLPVLTMIIAALDGFNPCAMWVLIFLITLLLNMGNRRRMWILGMSFIGASALVYFLFLTAWLNLFLFLGFIFWVRLAIGAVAIGSGVYHLREYWVNRSGVCKVTHGEKRKAIFEKLKQITHKESFWLALGGVILLAFAVNLVELVCSAGLPAVYTNVLSLSNLPTWQYYAYLLLYIIIFMADDMIVFFVAMKTLQITGVSQKYSRASNLIGGAIILILGILLIFKPGLLMFG